MPPPLRHACGASTRSSRARRRSRVSPGAARRLALLVLTALAGWSIPAAAASACESVGSPSAASAQRHARAVRCELNQERASHGLGALRYDETLALAARRFSTAMVRQGFFDHVAPDGSTLGRRLREAGFHMAGGVGETIGWGSGSQARPAAIVAAWMASPPHRTIILDGRFDAVGLGVAPGSPVGAAGAATVTANFAG